MKLWNIDTEIHFFQQALNHFASPEKLFYKLNNRYFAYVPKEFQSQGEILQSRNSLIGNFTEKWAKDLLSPVAKKHGLYAINNVVCEEIGLTKKSSADIAFCTKEDNYQKASDIKLIFEVKMSIVSNFELVHKEIVYIGDYKSHKGNPGLLRSDSMLKAIGKSVNIRVSGFESRNIPIIILGNSPITESYQNKVDFLKNSGVIQGFWSLNPHPADSDYIRNTEKYGFTTIENYLALEKICADTLQKDFYFISSMMPKQKLGEIISLAYRGETDIKKAEIFLKMIEKL